MRQSLMDKSKRRIVEDQIYKASEHLETAKKRLNSYNRYSESIEASQECIELSVKSVLSLLEIKYPRSHGWEQDKKEFAAIAKEIQGRQLLQRLAEQYLDHDVPLARLLFLVNFWSHFYTAAKYGFEIEHLASAKDLFKKEEAELAVQHAEECYRAASRLRYLKEDELTAIVSKP